MDRWSITIRIGQRYWCTITLQQKDGEPDTYKVTADWSPRAPKALTNAEQLQYQAGKDAIMDFVANERGIDRSEKAWH